MLESNETISHCPFCGSEDVGPGYRQHPNNRMIAMITCVNCGASGPVFPMPNKIEEMAEADQKALQGWETRIACP